MIGRDIHKLAQRLWPINRSLTGNGVRQTLAVIRELLPDMTLHEVPSGTRVLDWTVPDEWNVREAWLEAPNGERFADVSTNNLHLVGYSTPVNCSLPLDELDSHLHSLPEQPQAIPYVTSYYSRRWGFCLAHRDRVALPQGNYRAYIDSTLAPGSLTYGELVIPGTTDREVFLSTYVCHPSMANNELSGPCVTTHLALWLMALSHRRYTYRIVFIPETIGSITYLAKNLEHLKRHVIAGFNITCVGDDRCHSYLPSRAGNSLSDRAALHALKHLVPEFVRYTYLDRGSDERQYCAPGIDLPIATMMRSKYGVYPEYHTSLDDLHLVTPTGLEGGFRALQQAIEIIENDCIPRITVLGEPQLGPRGLYPTLSSKGSTSGVQDMMNVLGYSDGGRSLLDIAELINVPMMKLVPLVRTLERHALLEISR